MPAELSLARDPFRALPVEFPSKGKHLLVRSIHPCDDPSASPQDDDNPQNGEHTGHVASLALHHGPVHTQMASSNSYGLPDSQGHRR